MIGLETLLAADEPVDEEAVRLADEREQARRDRRLRARRRAARPSSPSAATRSATPRDGPGARAIRDRRPVSGGRAVAKLRSAAQIVYGRNPVREALRGRRRVLSAGRGTRVWARARRRAGRPCDGRAAPSSTGSAGSPDHQGVVVRGRALSATSTPRTCSTPRTRWWSRSTRCRTRRTSAPICRAAECAGATGVVMPERRVGRGHAGRLPGVRRRRRAPADRAGAEPRRLPARRPTDRGAWVYGAEAGADDRLHRARLLGPRRCSCSASEGDGPAAARAGGLRPAGLAPAARADRRRSTSRPPRRCCCTRRSRGGAQADAARLDGDTSSRRPLDKSPELRRIAAQPKAGLEVEALEARRLEAP